MARLAHEAGNGPCQQDSPRPARAHAAPDAVQQSERSGDVEALGVCLPALEGPAVLPLASKPTASLSWQLPHRRNGPLAGTLGLVFVGRIAHRRCDCLA